MIPINGEMVMCSRCPKAMYAHLLKADDGALSVAFSCEDCDDRPAPGDLTDEYVWEIRHEWGMKIANALREIDVEAAVGPDRRRTAPHRHPDHQRRSGGPDHPRAGRQHRATPADHGRH
jgi:hypothetical protein